MLPQFHGKETPIGFSLFSERARLASARAVVEHLAEHLEAGISVRLWDGSVVPMGPAADPSVQLVLRSPGTISSLLRWPTLDNLLRHYATGRIDVHGVDFQTFAEKAHQRGLKRRLKKVNKWWCFWKLLPLLLGPADHSTVEHSYPAEAGLGEITGRANKDFIQFHYDVSNKFYELFLGEDMQYTC